MVRGAPVRRVGRGGSDFYDAVYELVRRVPRGRVTTYGYVAAVLGKPRAARTIGWALHALAEDSDVPWQRVVNHRGGISIWKVGVPAELQRALLEEEGIEFRADGMIDLKRWGWAAPEPWPGCPPESRPARRRRVASSRRSRS